MRPTRRSIVRGAGAALAAAALGSAPARGADGAPAAPEAAKRIPSTGEAIPAIGLGSWIVFNVGEDPALRANSRAVVAAFVEAGGGMIDSSPMYGSSQEVIGDCLARLGRPAGVFSADKVWTGAADGPAQIAETERLWGAAPLDLLQVHNLLAWETHLETLFAMKAAGEVRHVGITTSHGRRHGDFEAVMAAYPLDFAQFTYNIVDREAEERLLPLARERGIAVICNRPFQRGWLPRRLEGENLPPWAAEIGAETWPKFLLKFIVSHPAATVAIPATSRVDHLRENKSAELGPMPDAATRRRMAAWVRDL